MIGKYPPAEPGALGIEPLKAAEFGAAGAAPRWWLGRFGGSFVPLGHTSIRIASWNWDETHGFCPHGPSLTMRSGPSMKPRLVCLAAHDWTRRRWVDFRKRQTATATPAEPGGLPVMLAVAAGLPRPSRQEGFPVRRRRRRRASPDEIPVPSLGSRCVSWAGREVRDRGHTRRSGV